MSEAELIELSFTAAEGAFTAIALYLTVISGYLIVAYLAGRELNGSQIVLVNVLFVFFTSFFVVSIYGSFFVAYGLQLELVEIRNMNPSFAENIWVMNQSLCVALILVIAGCTHFMWRIRRPSPEVDA